MKKRFCVVLLSLALLFSSFTVRGSTVRADDFKVNAFMAVYSISTEEYIRGSDGHLDALGPDEYISFAVDVVNVSQRDLLLDSIYFRVDGGEKLGLQGFTMKAGQSIRGHIYYSNMKKLSPGTHRMDFYLNDTLIHSGDLHLVRAWNSLMTYPSSSQISAVSGTARSPYVVYYPQFPYVNGLTEYSIDFWIDDMDDCTYFSTMDWDMDISSLQSRYQSVYNDYNTPGGVYCGFQRWENGETGVIMSVWDNFCKDWNGNVSIICAKELYPEVREGVSHTSGEGSFQQFIQPYRWEEKHPYRMLMQMSTSTETGNTVLTMWVCDLVSMHWDMLVSWDLGYKSNFMKTYALGGFMENYGTRYAGFVRNVSFSNIRGRDYQSNRWVAARSVTFTVNNSMTAMDYAGSYNFGSDDSTFWIITSGVNGLCGNPASGSTYYVSHASEDSPY